MVEVGNRLKDAGVNVFMISACKNMKWESTRVTKRLWWEDSRMMNANGKDTKRF